MLLTSPLGVLYNVLQNVCANANTNALLLRKNEAATRAALIDPVLRALGWDTANVQMVEPERTIGGELRVDYLLHDVGNKPRFVIEAKCLGSSLDKHGYVSKVLGYALGFKVQTVFITDGIDWHCYSNLHKGNIEPIIFTLTPDDLLQAALHLIQWLDAAQSGHGIMNSGASTTKDTKAASVVSLSEKRAVDKAKKPIESTSENFVELTQINTLQLEPNRKPKQLRLPDGVVKPIKSWKDLLLEASHFLLQTNTAITFPFLDKSGKKTALFSRQRPQKGSSSTTIYQGHPLYIYTNYSAPSCLANALYVFGKLSAQERQYEPAIAF